MATLLRDTYSTFNFNCTLKAELANEDTLLRTHRCSRCVLGAQTCGTQNEYYVFMLRKLGNICCGHKMFLNKIRTIFFVCVYPGDKICVRNKCCARGQTGKHLCEQQCVRNILNGSSSARVFSTENYFIFLLSCFA